MVEIRMPPEDVVHPYVEYEESAGESDCTDPFALRGKDAVSDAIRLLAGILLDPEVPFRVNKKCLKCRFLIGNRHRVCEPGELLEHPRCLAPIQQCPSLPFKIPIL